MIAKVSISFVIAFSKDMVQSTNHIRATFGNKVAGGVNRA